MDHSVRGHAPGADLLATIGRHLVALVVPVLLLGAAGAAYGLLREPQHTAETRVSIGQLNLSSFGVPGFVFAGSSLAGAYARTIDAPAVTRTAGARVGLSQEEARDALSASSIPDAPLFRVEATTDDEGKSVRLANAAAQRLVTYVLQINRRANLREQVLRKYRRAAR